MRRMRWPRLRPLTMMQTDEFITPKVIAGYDGMRDGDAVVMVNFRADRVRQIPSCWLYPEETGFAPQRQHSAASP